MSRVAQPPFAVGARVRRASWMPVIPACAGRPFVGRETDLEVVEVTGRGTKRFPWQVIAGMPGNPDPTICWYLDPVGLVSVQYLVEVE